MVGLMQIMIYLFCVYLVYKGIEIFQIAFVSSEGQRSRQVGIVIGILLTIGAGAISAIAVFLSDSMAARIGNNMPK